MSRFRSATGAAVLSLFAGIWLLAGTAAADYPERPVKLVVPFPAGGAADLPCRIFAEGLSRKLGQQFVIENRVGAAGALGTEVVVRAAPDGYTVLCGQNGPLVLLPQVRTLSYKPADLEPVAFYGENIFSFGVLPALGVKNMKELAELAKSKPGKLTYASAGVGSSTNLRGESFKKLAGVDIVHVPYRSGAEAINDLMGGRLDIMIDNVFLPQVRLGQVVMLGVLGNIRHPEFPDVPTLGEQGFPVDLVLWGGFLVPTGTPQAIQERLGKAVNELSAEPEVKERMLKIGWAVRTASTAEIHKQMEGDLAAYGKWIKATDFKIE